MIEFLPKWVLGQSRPAFYEMESVTAIEMASKLHGKMNELIAGYNSFVDEANKKINDFITSTEKDYEAFEVALRQEFQDFIDTVNLHVSGLSETIKDEIESKTSEIYKYLEEMESRVNEAVSNIQPKEWTMAEYNEDGALIPKSAKEFIFVNNDGTVPTQPCIFDLSVIFYGGTQNQYYFPVLLYVNDGEGTFQEFMDVEIINQGDFYILKNEEYIFEDGLYYILYR